MTEKEKKKQEERKEIGKEECNKVGKGKRKDKGISLGEQGRKSQPTSNYFQNS